MADDKKKKKRSGVKRSGGPRAGKTRQEFVENMAAEGWDPQSRNNTYATYGDIDPSDVHEGDAVFGATTATDSPSTLRTSYARNVKRGEGKDYFRFQKKLYKITHPFGATHEEVQV